MLMVQSLLSLPFYYWAGRSDNITYTWDNNQALAVAGYFFAQH